MKHPVLVATFVTVSLLLFILGIVLYMGNYFDNVLNLLPYNKIPKIESDIKLQPENKDKSDIYNKWVVERSPYCEGLTEAECFEKLTECKDVSLLDGITRTTQKVIDPSTPRQSIVEIKPPIETILPSAKFYKSIEFLGGGDSASYPFVELGNKYCKLNDENAAILFAQIKSPAQALEYYKFLRQDLGGAFEQEEKYILNSEMYDSPEILYNSGTCKDKYKEIMDNRVTTTLPVEYGFEIDLIKFTHIGKTQFTETKIKVVPIGSIIEEKPKVLLDCGMGALF